MVQEIAGASRLTDLSEESRPDILAEWPRVLAVQRAALQSLADELAQVETRQRRAIALELHDSLAQQLAHLYSGIQHCERLIERDPEAAQLELGRLRRIVQETIREARAMIRDLHFGAAAQGEGLAELGDYIAALEADTGVRHTFRLAGPLTELTPTQEALVLRIIQEALINVRKHAAASHIEVVFGDVDGELRAIVRDDGVGFDVEEARARSRRRGRFGLIGMRERAQLLDASLDILSAPGQGTTVCLTMPRAGGHHGSGDPHPAR
jgi:two-component system, NarL family, sensor histidine kinase DegS